MHRPVLVTAPTVLPVTLAEVRSQLRLDEYDEDPLLSILLDAAIERLDGWNGILGRALSQQIWRQDFDSFSECLRLPLGPVISVGSVVYRNAEGQLSTVGTSSYALLNDEAGARVFMKSGFTAPTSLAETVPISITYTAGYPVVNDFSTVPAPLKMAILQLVGHWYQNREASVVGTSAMELPLSVSSLIAPYRYIGI
ncbi:putative phiE125 gp8 family phage protein [Rhodoligotrophos appendicifer]|uniref:head-tail connector protein n=1 Tax=Rhodoligotrophos appendicifer TaxID=987056 RepID=UPI001186433C|nr:head-tail connector protein [Rhodoligotrophos appendicifer]